MRNDYFRPQIKNQLRTSNPTVDTAQKRQLVHRQQKVKEELRGSTPAEEFRWKNDAVTATTTIHPQDACEVLAAGQNPAPTKSETKPYSLNSEGRISPGCSRSVRAFPAPTPSRSLGSKYLDINLSLHICMLCLGVPRRCRAGRSTRLCGVDAN